MQRATSFLLVLAFALTGYGQAKNKTYKSVYRVASADFGLRTSDSTVPGMGLPKEGITLPLGTMHYANYYREGYSRMDIYFEAAPGISVRNGNKTASLFTREGDKALYLFENERQVDAYPYTAPQLVNTKKTKEIGGKRCTAYAFTGTDSLITTVWFSKGIPGWVSPGLRHPALGGVARIDYALQGECWSLVLESFAETDEAIDFQPGLPLPKASPKLHFLYIRNDGL